ncbi:MAG TPA: isoleucine--tRNA ligase [Candidatus Oscillibacter excrementigallinarum]|uniref:Isoleucine--tRNA ligase n=2 Tax=Oscillibacter TaxID=459786 RepID=A0A9D2LIU5_9FIRM|nr:isoleucine--tRNA ligase [Candidatus Oscillibacter excrementigallinarum]
MDYNKTINLPKTDFPMRAGLPKREPEMLKRWQEQDVYHEMLKKNEGKPLFNLHDGPPFSNGSIHMGTAMNKALKDIITRSYAMRGYYTPYIPGWDNHGMPIESAIIKQNKLNHKAMSIPDFRSACHDFALHYVGVQKEAFMRMGVLGDWDHPYLTMNPGFEAEEVKVFGEMYKKGYIYKGFKPVYWCPHDETALAEAEIEYHDDPCTTVYVKFPMHDDLGKLPGYDKLFFVIWTTTIWTLPGNLAIALHPEESYAVVKAPNGESYIMAEALVEKVMKLGGFDTWEVAETHPGAFFENMLADHPFLPKTSRLLLADYVTMDSGTGCVHTAPGFGADDYETCKRYGIEMVVPVDDQGRHTDYAGKYAGLKTDESNPVILNDMKESGMLFASEDIVHSYPHCWRCKGPIIFRATPQWFCSVESFKDEACAACEDVRWVPAWGKDRMKAMIRERNDWCISRQRKWGLPIPVFYCKDCGKPICTDETIAAISKLFAAEGSNAWFAKEAEEILPEGFACPHCGSKSGFTKETDTLDGWFDSGSTHFSAMKKDQGFWPATMYLEGLDQYRGWFQSALLTAVGAFGKGAPFKECVTHGWTVDGEGKAMHKSLGNGMDPAEIIDQYGADLLRLWAASADYHADVRCSHEIFKQLSQNYLKFRNTARYCLGNLDGFDADHLTPPAEMEELDRWAVTRLNALMEKCAKAYDDYEFLVVTHAVNDFCVVDMSNFYLDIIKDRLYCEEKDGAKRRSAQTALFLILDTMTKIMAPILAFTSDEIWLSMPHRSSDDARNVVFNDMNQPFTDYALDDKAMEKWSTVEKLRDDVNAVLEAARAEKKIGKALEAHVALHAGDDAASAALVQVMGLNLAELFIVSDCQVSNGSPDTASTVGKGTSFPGLTVEVSEAKGEKCARCWMHSPTVGADADHPTLCARCAAVVRTLPQF